MINYYSPVQTTPFSRKEKIKARLWRIVWVLFYRPTPWFFYRYRVWLLNQFGARVDASAHPENSAFIEFPWNLVMGKQASLGERSWVYCLDNISIGDNSCIGQGCQLITGSHNYKSRNFELTTSAITIRIGCWLTSNVTVLGGVAIGDYAVIGVNSLVTKTISENTVAFGQPAKAHGKRFD